MAGEVEGQREPDNSGAGNDNFDCFHSSIVGCRNGYLRLARDSRLGRFDLGLVAFNSLRMKGNDMSDLPDEPVVERSYTGAFLA